MPKKYLIAQHIPQMLLWMKIWRNWRLSQHIDLVVVFKPFLNHFYSVAGNIILLKEARVIREECALRGAPGLHQCLGRWYVLK